MAVHAAHRKLSFFTEFKGLTQAEKCSDMTFKEEYNYSKKLLLPKLNYLLVRSMECMVLFMKKSHVASDCHLFLIQPVCSLRYTNRFVMHVSKGKLNVNINTWFKLLKCQISIIKPHVLLFDKFVMEL